MAIRTLSELRTQAQVIKNEVTTGANTADRVGTFLDETLESLDSLMGHFWQHYKDSTYTSGSTLSIPAGARTQLTNDGLLRYTESPNGYANVWNTLTNKITPIALNDFYTVRLDIKGMSDSAPTNRFDVEMDIGGSLGTIASLTAVFAKGAGNPQSFNFSSQFFVGTTFIANGGAIYITPESDASFWDIGLTISRVYKEQA